VERSERDLPVSRSNSVRVAVVQVASLLFCTDHLLVRCERFPETVAALRAAGYLVEWTEA